MSVSGFIKCRCNYNGLALNSDKFKYMIISIRNISLPLNSLFLGTEPMQSKRNVRYFGGGGRCHNLKNGKEASEDTEKSPAGCAGEGKQYKGN